MIFECYQFLLYNCCLLYTSKDDLAVRRIINVPKRGIGATTLSRVQDYASERGIDVYKRQAPKILWVKENEPENFKKIRKIMLPKDYLAYKLSGVHCCDMSCLLYTSKQFPLW